jgi:hypothetical protein
MNLNAFGGAKIVQKGQKDPNILEMACILLVIKENHVFTLLFMLKEIFHRFSNQNMF